MKSVAAKKQRVGYRDVFHNSNWIRLWAGQTISQLGDALASVAFPLLVYDLTRSAANLGFAFALETLPLVIVGPFAGIVVDHVNRRTVLLVVDGVRVLCMLGIFLSASIWQIYALVLLAGSMQATFLPAYSAVIPQITGDQYVKSISLSYTGYRTMLLIGPALAAVLLGILQGPRPIFLIDAVTFAVGFLLTLTVHIDFTATTRPALHVMQDLRDGLVVLRHQAVVRYLTVYNMVLTFAAVLAALGTILYIKTGLDLTASASNRLYGVTGALLAASVALATWLIGWADTQISRRALVLWGPVLMGIAYLAFAFRPGVAGVLVLIVIVSLGQACAQAPVSIYFATAITNEVRGRVYSFMNALNGLITFIAFGLFGILGLVLAPAMLLILAGACLVIGIPVCGLILGGARALQDHDMQQNAA